MIRQSNKGNLKKLGTNIKSSGSKAIKPSAVVVCLWIDNNKISKIEESHINITFTTILQLAKALEVHPTELLKTELD